MSASDSKVIEKRIPGDGKDRGSGGRFKDMGGSNPYKKPRFTGDCDDLKECTFDCEDGKQASNFEMNIKKLSIYAATKYDMGAVIMTMIDEMTKSEMNRPVPYTGEDPIEAKIFELRIAQYINNQQKLENECKKLYTVILGQCTSYMTAKLKAMPTFKEMHHEKDPIKLLKAIKGLTFRFDSEKEYEMSLVEAIDKLYRFYQGKDMSNTQFLEKFNNLVDVIEHYGGTIGVHKKITEDILAKHTGGTYDSVNWKLAYTDDQMKKATEKGKERILARMFLNRIDRTRYGSMLVKLNNDYVTGRHDVFPNDRISAFALINNWNNGYEKSYQNPSYSGTSFAQSGSRLANGIACWGCGKEGITLAECTNANCIKRFKAKQDRKQPGGDSSTFQGQQHLNVKSVNEDSMEDGSNKNDSDKEYNGYYVGYDFHQQDNNILNSSQGKVGDSLILLDSQSTHSTFYSAKLVQNIRDALKPLRMLTNAGTIIYNQQADLPNYGVVWFNQNSIANIISMSEAERRGHMISYSPGCLTLTSKENTSTMSFKMNPSGLYVFKAPDLGLSLVQTINENSKFLTPRQIESAKRARDLYEMIGRPSSVDFIAIIKNNLLPNVDISVKDVENAQRIFGKDLGSVQGKTVRLRPEAVTTDYFQVPPDVMTLHQDVTIAVDVMHVDGMQFLITTSRNIQFTTVDRLESKEWRALMTSLEKVINLYKKRGFKVRTCLGDGEFENLRDSLLHTGVHLNVCAPGEHISEVERKIRTVKERIRSILTTLPFKRLPPILVAHAVIFSTMWINFFAPKGGISNTLSPQAIVTGLSPNADKHCKIPFGGYAQVYVDSSQGNSVMRSRTVGAISLGPTGNIQGTYKFMSLLTGRLIKARSFTPLPMPEEVIMQVERMGTFKSASSEDEDDNDDISLASSNYSNISQGELADLLINNQTQVETNENYIPDTVQSQATQENEVQIEGVDREFQEAEIIHDNQQSWDANIGRQEVLSENEELESGDEKSVDSGNHEDLINNDIIEEQEDTNEIEEGFDAEDDAKTSIAKEDFEREENLLETIDNSSRVQYITKRGRNVKLRKDLFDNYEFLQEGLLNNYEDQKYKNVSTQWSLKQGLKHFPKETREATLSELMQLHNMKVFEPMDRSLMSKQDILGTLNTLTFIKRKRCGRIKARTCADGRPQRDLYQKWEASSPTVRTESVLFTSMLDAHEGRIVGVYDIPGAFLHAKQTDLTYVRMTGDAAKLLVEISPDTYKGYMTSERGKDVIYLTLKKALYGCMKSALLFWEHLSGKLIERDYKLNPYDSCVANKAINGSQMTIVWHVDDLKLSHVSEMVLDGEVEWLETIYGSLVGSKGNCHTYLGMDMHFNNRKLQISMTGYLHEIIDEFPFEIMGKVVSTPAAPHLFDKDKDAIPLDTNKARIFHQVVAKTLWAAIRVRPDLLTTLSYLTCQVKAPDEDDMKKLVRMIAYIRDTVNLPLTLGIENVNEVRWWVDASFGTRFEMKSQTGATLSLGIGSIYSMSRKQKLNTTSSTEAEIVGVHDAMSQIIWFRHFIIAQEVKIYRNILFQDNRSAILLHRNGTNSSSRNTRHINIRYFFLKDRIKSGEIEVVFCPSEEMIADFFTKPIQGRRFMDLRKMIMGEHDEQG